EKLKDQIQGPIFLATDNRDVLDFVRLTFGGDRVFSFSKLPKEAGKPLHMDDTTDNYHRNADAIVDLVMLSLSRQLCLFALSDNRFEAKYSGYSVFAKDLRAFPSI